MFYEEGVKFACMQLGIEKQAYSVAKNIAGALREGVGYLTPEAKTTLLSALAGGGVGAAGGALTDAPGGAAGGALAGLAGGAAGGRLGQTLARRYGKSHAAARAFGSAGSARPATRAELLEALKKTSSVWQNPLTRTIGGSLLGAGVGAGAGELTGDAGLGAALGAGAGGALGRYGQKLVAPARQHLEKLTSKMRKLRSGETATAAPAVSTASASPATPPMTMGEYMSRPAEVPEEIFKTIRARFPELANNPEAWQAFAKEKGINLLR
jgi:hypothetical protein